MNLVANIQTILWANGARIMGDWAWGSGQYYGRLNKGNGNWAKWEKGGAKRGDEMKYKLADLEGMENIKRLLDEIEKIISQVIKKDVALILYEKEEGEK